MKAKIEEVLNKEYKKLNDPILQSHFLNYSCVLISGYLEKEIQSIHAMHVPADYWRSLWPANISPFLAEAAFDGISNSPADDERWALRMAGLQETWQANLPGGSPAKLHLKRDHSQQRRVQCSISREGFNELFQLTYDPALTDRLKEALDA